jgi:carbon-monoxide dehydrogenase medium subunit
MIPLEFEYEAPDTLEGAIALLAGGDEDVKVLAGGHSLIPLMKLRLAAPSLLVDIRKVPGLKGVTRSNGDFAIGALTPHATVAGSNELGLTAVVAGTIADPQVRHRGTIGGSLAHGDPASDLPGVLLGAEGSVTVQGPNGQRSIGAADLFEDYLTTSIADDEILTSVSIPAMDGYGYAYEKFNRRAEDWAMPCRTCASPSRTWAPPRSGQPGSRKRCAGSRPAPSPSRRRPSSLRRAPSPPATSTPRPITSATSRGCSPAGR